MTILHFYTTVQNLFSYNSLITLRSRLAPYVSVQKLLITASLLIVLLFDVFHIYTDPTSLAPVGSIGFEAARLLTAMLLFFLLVTDPPRALAFRIVLGISAVAIVTTAVYSFLAYQLGFIDTVLYLEVAIILGLEALEPKTQPGLWRRVFNRGLPLA